MKTIAILVLLIAVCKSSPVVLYREVAPDKWEPELVTNRLTSYNVSNEDVKIYFRTSEFLLPVNLNNPKEVNGDGFSNKKDTVFIIHGWNNEYDSPVSLEISEAILQVKDANVFIVDWSSIAKKLYPVAQAAVPSIAYIVSQLITSLEDNNGLDLDKTSIVGHSLGAHVAGICGSDLGGRLSHIVGLDPALPLFNFADKDNRLDYSDAQFVEVIHTCSGLLGFNQAIGDVDYWPNGGSNQPGCGGIFDIGGICSHGRSIKYFAESILSGGFLSHKCDNYNDFKSGKCNSEPASLMGGINLDKEATGSYYLNTNSQSPFSKN